MAFRLALAAVLLVLGAHAALAAPIAEGLADHSVTSWTDLYNAFNANPVVLLNNNYAAWQVPQGILQSRFVKLSAQLDF